MVSNSGRKESERIKVFRELFTGLPHAYGTYNPVSGRFWTVKNPVTDKVIHNHLKGKKPYGVFLLVKDCTRAIVVDFDKNDTRLPTDFINRAAHYEITAYIERSKVKGHHVWTFFEDTGVPAIKARRVMSHILSEIDAPGTEIFPEHDAIGARIQYGKWVNTPLFGRLVPQEKTVFVDPVHFEPYPDQWALLESVVRHSESALDTIIEMNDISLDPPDKIINEGNINGDKTSFGLPPCAQKMCMDGVRENQRVSCFRLAVHFRRLGLPYDMAVAALKTWALKNRSVNGKGVIREDEILAQSMYAYNGDYRGYGCESVAIKPFCDPSCPVIQWRKQKQDLIQ